MSTEYQELPQAQTENILTLSQKFGVQAGRFITQAVGRDDLRPIFFRKNGTPKEYLELVDQYSPYRQRKRDIQKDTERFINAIAGKYDCVEGIKDRIEKYSQFHLFLPQENAQAIRTNAISWIDALRREITDHSATISKNLALSSKNPIDGLPLVPREKKAEIEAMHFATRFIPGKRGDYGITILIPEKNSVLLIDDREVQKIQSSLELVEKTLGIIRSAPIKYTIFPRDFIRAHQAFANRQVFLAADPDISNIYGKYRIPKAIAYHENVHILLATLLGGKHPPNTDLIEGFARGVETILTNPKKYADPWDKVAADAFQLLRQGLNPIVSNTYLLEERGQGNLYNLSYEMDALVGVLSQLFPVSWPEIMKKMYLKATEKLHNEQGITIQRTHGVKPSYIPQRVVNHAVLKEALVNVDPNENPSIPLVPLMQLTPYSNWKEALPHFIQAATLAMMKTNKP